MKLVGYEAKALMAWAETSEDFDVLSFKSIATKAEIDPSKVRRAVRGLASKGLTKFYRTSWSDEGIPYGAGYGLTDAGRAALNNEVRK